MTLTIIPLGQQRLKCGRPRSKRARKNRKGEFHIAKPGVPLSAFRFPPGTTQTAAAWIHRQKISEIFRNRPKLSPGPLFGVKSNGALGGRLVAEQGQRENKQERREGDISP